MVVGRGNEEAGRQAIMKLWHERRMLEGRERREV